MLTSHWSRQPPRFGRPVSGVDPLLPGSVGAQSPAAAAQFRVGPLCALDSRQKQVIEETATVRELRLGGFIEL